MAKTAEPHLDSFFAFACRASQILQETDEAFPDWLPVEAFGVPESAREAAVLDDLKARAEAFEYVQSEIIAQELREAGVSERQLRTPAMQKYVSRQINVARLGLLHRPDQNTRRRNSTAEWRPPRQIVVEVIAGAHFALGCRTRKTTADFLNRGMARMDDNQGVTDSEVRNAMDAFMRSHLSLCLRDFGRVEVTIGLLAWRSRVLDLIWCQAPARPQYAGLSGLDLAHRTAETGALWRARLRACDCLAPDAPPKAIHATLIKTIGELEKLQARQAA